MDSRQSSKMELFFDTGSTHSAVSRNRLRELQQAAGNKHMITLQLDDLKASLTSRFGVVELPSKEVINSDEDVKRHWSGFNRDRLTGQDIIDRDFIVRAAEAAKMSRQLMRQRAVKSQFEHLTPAQIQEI